MCQYGSNTWSKTLVEDQIPLERFHMTQFNKCIRFFIIFLWIKYSNICFSRYITKIKFMNFEKPCIHQHMIFKHLLRGPNIASPCKRKG